MKRLVIGVSSNPRRLCRRLLAIGTVVLGTISPLLIPMTVVRAQSVDLFNWQSVNTQGMGYVTGISVGKLSPYDVYVRTDVGGAYRYDRTNEAWIPLFDKFDTGFSGGGIGIEAVAADPSNASRVYAAANYGYSTFVDTDGKTKYNYAGEVFSSLDKGATWTATGLATSAHVVYVGPNSSYRTNTGERIGVDPNKGDCIYFASSRDGLWSKNGSGAWTRVNGGLPAPNTLPGYYANGQNGAANDGFPGFTFVCFDKSTGTAGNLTQKIYVGVFGSGVWCSTNGGTSWSKLAGSYQYPRRAAIASDGTLYVSGGIDGNLKDSSGNAYGSVGSVYRYSSNAWTEIRPSDTTSDYGVYSAIAVDPNVSSTVIVSRGGKVWRSTNSGTSWGAALTITKSDGSLAGAPGYYSTAMDAASGVASVAIDPSDTKKVWWTNGWGVTRTDDVTIAAPIWTWRMKNLEELDTNMLRVPPKTGGAALWTATQDMIGFRHNAANTVPGSKFNPNNVPTDPQNAWANGTWTVFPNPFPHVAGATGIDYSYNQPDYGAFVGFHQWQYQSYGPYSPVYGKTTDNGVTWNAFGSVPTESLYISWASQRANIKATGGQIAVSPTDPNRMVWAGSNSTWPHYTTDGGQNWYLCYNLDHGAQPSPYDANNNDHVHYQNLPQAWGNNITPWVNSYILAADRKDSTGKTFYYYDCFSFYYSIDGGANWHKSAASLPSWIVRPAIVPNPLTQGDVWMTFARNTGDATPNQLYRSQNGGVSFAPVSTVNSAEFIAFGKGTSSTTPCLYLWGRVGGATKDAMYKSDDLGGTWTRILDPNTQQFPGITYMDADMRTAGLVYVATTGRGYFYGSKATSGSNNGTGLLGSYFNNLTLAGTATTRTDATVNFDWGTGAPGVSGIGVDNFSTRWDGQVEAPATGSYTFTTTSDDGVRLWVNGTQLVNNWTDHGSTNDTGTINLTAGQKYTIKMEYYEKTGGAVAKLQWAYPSQALQAIPQTRLYPATATNTDTAKYNFESGVQGWAQSQGTVAVSTSTTQKYAGNSSLAAAITATAAGDTGLRVLNTGSSTPMPAAGQTVTYRVWVPSGSAVTGFTVFVQDANWTWTGNTGTVTPGQWSTVTLTVPSGAVAPMNALGITFTTSGAWSGTCYIDSVNW